MKSMNKLLITALLVMMCGSMSAQEVPDTIIDGNKYVLCGDKRTKKC